MVGLGKTLQLVMSGLLIALYGTGPVLVIAPKTLLWQCQDEMHRLLAMPSALWTGTHWVDEHGIEHPVSGPAGIKHCPRRVDLVSQGLITSKSEAVSYLTQLTYKCVIVDEAHLPQTCAVAAGSDWDRLGNPDKSRLRRLARDFAPQHNPFIRHIVRRTRDYLETTLDPETGEPYLKPVRVEFFGERDDEAIPLPLYLQDACKHAEEFCQLMASRSKGSGFLKTLLLRRVGSTMYAGRKTAEHMLGPQFNLSEAEDPEDDEPPDTRIHNTLTSVERDQLRTFREALVANQDRAPKCGVVLNLLQQKGWIEDGCIIFSKYYDSIMWLAE